MADQKTVSIGSIALDLRNFRILPQANEEDALKAIVAIHPDWFWGLVQSLLADGYEPTENLLLLETGSGRKGLVVKEGNRRVAAMKFLLGNLKGKEVPVPDSIRTAISSMAPDLKTTFNEIPCLVYPADESERLDRIVARVHGKGDKSGRQTWTAVTKARHNRDHNKREEYGLDMLEAYLKDGKNLQPFQRQQWAGDYGVTVLDEAIQKLTPRLGMKTARGVVDLYQKGTHRSAFEAMLLAIGNKEFKFKGVRNEGGADFERFGFPALGGAPSPSPQGGGASGAAGASGAGDPSAGGAGNPGGGQGAGAGASGQPTGSANIQAAGAKKPKAKATNDPSSVIPTLRKLKPRGENRSKVVTLQKEAVRLSLDIDGHPHAFCFLFRSMIELSAKAYCEDHKKDGLTYTTKDGKDMELSRVLQSVIDHYTDHGKDEAAKRKIKGATAELNNPHGFLSVHSMNQLIHHPSFTVDGPHIATVFHNIFPFLQVLSE
jgi:hypothetical protein